MGRQVLVAVAEPVRPIASITPVSQVIPIPRVIPDAVVPRVALDAFVLPASAVTDVGAFRGFEDFGAAGGEVEEGGERFRARDAVDDRVVHLRVDGHRPVGQPVDEVHLPQRVRPVQPPGVDLGHRVGELPHAAGRGQSQLEQVAIEIEVRIVSPVGPVQPERHLHEAQAQRRREVEAFEQEAGERLPVEAATGRVENRQPRDMSGGGRGLGVQELRVERGQLAHLLSFSPGTFTIA
jgi:hypothetical protein